MRKSQRTSKYGIKNVKTNTNSTKCTTLTILLRNGEDLKIHKQHWRTHQEQAKNINNTDPIINWRGMNSRDTDNIGEQFKKQTKYMSNTDPVKNWGGVNSRDTDNIDEKFKKQTNNISNTDPMKNWGG